jgi:predicted extracellular nuclease
LTSPRTRIAALATLAIPILLIAPPALAAPSASVMIAEVYGGGGNAGATLTRDFIELGNADSAGADVAGWSVQYLPASPTATSTWQVTPLSGSVPAGGRYLVGEATGAGGTTQLPTTDASGTIAMSATAGTVALVNTTTALTCKTAADCAADTRIVDLVGYGSAVVRETSPTAGTTNTTSAARPALTDTDNNSTDFAVGPPTPQNTSDVPPPPPTPAAISAIQGTTHRSPLADATVETSGVVTAVRAFGSARGFWMQDPTPDDDPATSEGIFVFTAATTPDLVPGDAATVTGTVSEFYPDGPPSSALHPSTTELTGATWLKDSVGNDLPAAESLAPDTVPEAFAPEPGGSIEALPLRPDDFAMDFFESREAMLVQVSDARVVGPTTPFNELFVTTKPNQNPTVRGGTLYSGYNQQNSGRLLIQSLIPFAERPFPQVDVGDVLTGVTSGPVDYSRFGGYMVQATRLGQVQDNHLQREITRAQQDNELAIATFNVENLDPGDPDDKFARLADGIVTNLRSPDIVALEEIQDNTGPTDDGTVAANLTLDKFTAAISAAGGPAYDWRQIDPVDNADGGEPGGNIRVGFLFNPNRVSFVDRPGGDATTPVEVRAGANKKLRLSISPGRIDPASSAWANSRKPLAGEFVFNDKTIFVVANHFTSKGGDQPLSGRFQPPTRSSEVQRIQQAREVREFVDAIRARDRNANIVVLGDLNDFDFSPTLATLTAGGVLDDLIRNLPVAERYNYVFQGNSQTLDHILVGGRMKSVDYDVVHINAEFADQASDHDPQVVRIKPGS